MAVRGRRVPRRRRRRRSYARFTGSTCYARRALLRKLSPPASPCQNDGVVGQTLCAKPTSPSSRTQSTPRCNRSACARARSRVCRTVKLTIRDDRPGTEPAYRISRTPGPSSSFVQKITYKTKHRVIRVADN